MQYCAESSICNWFTSSDMNFEAEIIAEIYFCTEFDYFEYTRNATENNLKFLFFAFFAYFSYDVSSNFEHTRDNQTWLKKLFPL